MCKARCQTIVDALLEKAPEYDSRIDGRTTHGNRFQAEGRFDEDYFRVTFRYDGEILQESLDALFRAIISERPEGYLFWGLNVDGSGSKVTVTYREEF